MSLWPTQLNFNWWRPHTQNMDRGKTNWNLNIVKTLFIFLKMIHFVCRPWKLGSRPSNKLLIDLNSKTVFFNHKTKPNSFEWKEISENKHDIKSSTLYFEWMIDSIVDKVIASVSFVFTWFSWMLFSVLWLWYVSANMNNQFWRGISRAKNGAENCMNIEHRPKEKETLLNFIFDSYHIRRKTGTQSGNEGENVSHRYFLKMFGISFVTYFWELKNPNWNFFYSRFHHRIREKNAFKTQQGTKFDNNIAVSILANKNKCTENTLSNSNFFPK